MSKDRKGVQGKETRRESAIKRRDESVQHLIVLCCSWTEAPLYRTVLHRNVLSRNVLC